jgi:hypothetical protein
MLQGVHGDVVVNAKTFLAQELGWRWLKSCCPVLLLGEPWITRLSRQRSSGRYGSEEASVEMKSVGSGCYSHRQCGSSVP